MTHADQADSAESLVLVHVPPDRIAPHPDNPRRTLGDLSELARSIATLGVLEPLLLVPVDAFNATADGDAITKAGIEWVAVAGHRRRAGAIKAKAATVPGVPRPDLADRVVALEVMLTENSQRNDLTPLEEARAFRQLRDAGRAQRDIAARLGRAQSHVSKRLALLDLPDEAQAAVENGRLAIGDAAELLRLRKHPAELAAVLEHALDPEDTDWTVAEMVENRLASIDRAKRIAEQDAAHEAHRRQAEGEARAAGAHVLGVDLAWDDAPQDLGRRHLTGEDSIQAARDADQLGAYYTAAGGIQYVDLAPTPEPAAQTAADASLVEPPAAAPREIPSSQDPHLWPEDQAPAQRSAVDLRERADAVRARQASEIARADVCARIVAELAGDPAVTAAASDGGRGDVLGDVAEVATVWLRSAGVEVIEEDTTYEALCWLDRHGDPANRYQVAGALALAAAEERLQGHTWDGWDGHDLAHLARLAAAGHQVSEWETDQMEQVSDVCDYTPGCGQPYGHPGQVRPGRPRRAGPRDRVTSRTATGHRAPTRAPVRRGRAGAMDMRRSTPTRLRSCRTTR